MKNADEKFLADLRVSPLGEKFAADMEIARLARRRNALRGWNAFAKTNARFIENLAAAQSEVAARRKAYEAAEAALIEAGSELYLATRAVDNLQLEEQRAEGAARGAVLRRATRAAKSCCSIRYGRLSRKRDARRCCPTPHIPLGIFNRAYRCQRRISPRAPRSLREFPLSNARSISSRSICSISTTTTNTDANSRSDPCRRPACRSARCRSAHSRRRRTGGG